MAANAATADGNEVHHRNGRGAVELGAGFGQQFREILAGEKELVIEPFEFQALGRRNLGAAQSDRIESANVVGAASDGKWRQVLADSRAALHDGQGAHANKLMHQAISRDENAIGHFHVARQESAVGNDDVIADDGIVADVRIDHEEIVRPKAGDSVRVGRTMHCDAFAKKVMIANDHARRFVLVFYVLGGIADDAAGVKPVVLADDGLPCQINVRSQAAARAQRNPAVDHTKGADFDAGVDLGIGMDDGGGMDHWPY